MLTLSPVFNAPQDITTFLAWASAPEHDERKLVGLKALTVIGIMWAFALYQKRLKVGSISAAGVLPTCRMSLRECQPLLSMLMASRWQNADDCTPFVTPPRSGRR